LELNLSCAYYTIYNQLLGNTDVYTKMGLCGLYQKFRNGDEIRGAHCTIMATSHTLMVDIQVWSCFGHAVPIAVASAKSKIYLLVLGHT